MVGIAQLTEDELAAMTLVDDDRRRYGNNHIAVMLQAMIDKTVSARLQSANLKMHVYEAVVGTVSSLRTLVKLTEVLLEANMFLKPVFVWSKRGRAGSGSQLVAQRTNENIRYSYLEDSTVRLSLSSEAPPINISDDRTNLKAYLVKNFDEEECQRGKIEDQTRGKKNQ